jgi:hypothetical protein
MAVRMMATGRYRWVECDDPKGRKAAATVIVRGEAQGHKARKFYKLQELWIPEAVGDEEWRDIPVHKARKGE